MNLPLVRYIKAHHVSRAALCVGVVVAAVLFFVIGIGVRLLMGPVSLGPLRSTLAGAIHDALPGITLDYDQAAIEWSRDQGRINLVVLGARMFDSRGRIVAQAPKADIDLAASSFLGGHIKVTRITLVGVQLTLVHMKAGGIRLGLEKDRYDDDIIGRISDVIDANGSEKSSLESFAVRDARLAIFDETTGLFVVAPRAALVIGARGDNIGVTFDADTEISGSHSHVLANLLLPQDKGPITGDLTVTGLDLRALGTNATMFEGVKAIPMTVNAATRFRTGAGGALNSADFDITGAGQVPFPALARKALHVKHLRLAGHYDGKARHLILSSALLDAREAQVRLTGKADFLNGADGSLDKVRASLNVSRLSLDMPGVFATPIAYQSLRLEADYLTGPRRFEIGRLTVAAPGFALDASGAMTINDHGAHGLAAKAHIAALPVRTLLHYWPLQVAPGARDWTDANIFAGTIGPLDATVDFPPGMLDQDVLPEPSLNLTFALSGVEGAYVHGLTHATGVAGSVLITGDTFHATFTGGHVGPLTIARGTALIPALHKTGTIGEFAAHIDGAMTDVMTLIDMAPLSYPTRFGIDPKQTGGSVSADLAFQVPMLANLPVDDVGISVKAAVSNFAVTLGRLHLANGAVTFDIDNSHLHQLGSVGLADTRLAVDWTEDFKTADPITTRLAVKGAMTEAARAALNINLLRYFRGTVPVTAAITGHRGSLVQADVAVDFTPATLSVPIVNLEKPAGVAAPGHVVANFAPGNTLQDETIRITGAALNATGTANFSQDGDLTVLNFPSVKMGALNDLSFQLTRGEDGENDYVLRGHSLDGARVGRNGAGNAAGDDTGAPARDDTPEGRFHVSAKLDKLAMRGGVSIMPFNMELGGVGIRPSALAMSGSLAYGGKTAPIAANIDPVPQGRKLILTAGDTGILVRGLFAFESMRGGAMTATAVLPGQAGDTDKPSGPDFSGTLVVKDFQMVNQPLLARLFSAGSFTGLGDLMGGDGMTMSELSMPFSSRNNVISVDGARASGPAIGASADGYIDRPKGQIALKGSLVPAFGLNSFVSNVPLLGDILASRKGEGIFGVTYSLTGSSEHPDLSTNPLSMLTPGILRRIFEGHIPTAANAPSNMPPAPAPPPNAQAAAPTPRPSPN